MKRKKDNVSEGDAFQRLSEDYITAAIRHFEALERADSRLANAAARDLIKTRAKILRDPIGGPRLLATLMRHESPAVRVWAAADSLPFGTEAANVLEVLSRIRGLVGLNAEASLMMWKRKQADEEQQAKP